MYVRNSKIDCLLVHCKLSLVFSRHSVIDFRFRSCAGLDSARRAAAPALSLGSRETDAGMMHAGEEAHSEEAMAQGVAPEKAEGDEDYANLQRVKVYRLNEGGHWDDKGTGHVSCEYMEVRVCMSD